VRAPIPLLSAIGFLIAAGMVAAQATWLAAVAAIILVGVALLLLADRDAELSARFVDELLDDVEAVSAWPILGERR